jgi:hypothetical protein
MTNVAEVFSDHGSGALCGSPGRRDTTSLFPMRSPDLPTMRSTNPGRHALSRLRRDAFGYRRKSHAIADGGCCWDRGGNSGRNRLGVLPRLAVLLGALVGIWRSRDDGPILDEASRFDLQAIALVIVIYGMVLSRVVLAQRFGMARRTSVTSVRSCNALLLTADP